MVSDFWIPQYIKIMTKECNQWYNKNRVGLLLLSGHRIGKQTERVENSLFIHTGLSVWVSIKTFSLFFESLHKLWIKITLRPHQTTFLPTSASPCRLKASQFLKIWLPEHEEGERPLWSEKPAWTPPRSFLSMKLYENRSSSSAFTYDISFLWMVCVSVYVRNKQSGKEESRWSEICAGLVTANPYGKLRCVLC